MTELTDIASENQLKRSIMTKKRHDDDFMFALVALSALVAAFWILMKG